MKLEVSGLTKSFGSKIVLKDISFSISKSEIFGLLGPNGAGKTTMIRVILDILRQDSGKVKILGKDFSENIKERVGYLPEEGSLYKESRVYDVIRYFAVLKGLGEPDSRIEEWLKRFDLYEHREKKVRDLSKGMQRMVMFIISVIHDPDIIILDEPFSGLDPVNKKLVKNIILELKKRGMTIIMSTHQMGEVERMCDRILMINKGNRVLYGGLNEIKKRFGFSLFVEYTGNLPKIQGAEIVEDYGNYAELILDKKTKTQDVLKKLISKVEVKKFEVKTRSLNEIFIEVVKNEK